MENTLHIAIIVGTSRQNRRSIHVANLITKVGSEIEGVETVLVDPQVFDLPYDGNDEKVKDPKYTKITEKADAFLIVVPEYNHSFSGSLKRLLDSESKNYIHKPVSFAGVSSGPWGGTRAVEALIPVVRELGMVVTFADLFFPKVQTLFDEKGNLLDEIHLERIQKAFTELIWMTKTLKWGRENLESKYH